MEMFQDLDDRNPLPPSVPDQRRSTIQRGRRLRRRRHALVGAAVAAVAVVSLGLWALPSINASQPPVRPNPTASATPLTLVVLGDSTVRTDHCPNCRSFATQYADTLTRRSGRPVATIMRSRNDNAGVPEILSQVTGDSTLRHDIASADVVVMSVGYNNVVPDYDHPPPGGPFTGCHEQAPNVGDYIIAHILATTPACTRKAVGAWAKDYDQIFTTIMALRRSKPTTVIAMTVVDGNLDNPDVRAALTPTQLTAFERVLVDAHNQWNAMLCARAAAHQAACADTYHAANGPNGDRAPTSFIDGNAFPSQAGNDLWASVLAQVDTSPVTG
jgi:hypothetical protein